MVENKEINKIIEDTIKEITSDKKVISLLNKSLKYELDIWNRSIPNSNINDKYDDVINEVYRE